MINYVTRVTSPFIYTLKQAWLLTPWKKHSSNTKTWQQILKTEINNRPAEQFKSRENVNVKAVNGSTAEELQRLSRQTADCRLQTTGKKTSGQTVTEPF